MWSSLEMSLRCREGIAGKTEGQPTSKVNSGVHDDLQSREESLQCEVRHMGTDA